MDSVSIINTCPPLDPHNPHRQVLLHMPVFTLYSDGSFERHTDTDLPACPEFVDGVASKDVGIDSSAGVWARIFLPEQVAHKNVKVPLILHFHGGGFCLGSPSTPPFHNFCSHMAIASQCIWMSVNYRLAPEHPLPAAYDDAHAVLLWLRSQASAHGDSSGAKSWLAQHADFAKCFLTGESAGGAIVHFLAARAAGKDWSPVRIQGLLLIHAGFLEEKRDELDTQANPHLMEFICKSTFPPGATRGHPLANPLHPDSPKLSEMDLPPVFVAVAEKDGLRYVNVEYYEVLKQAGKNAQLFETPGEDHCFHMVKERGDAARLLERRMVQFIESLSKAGF